jgi:hypothetical protein
MFELETIYEPIVGSDADVTLGCWGSTERGWAAIGIDGVQIELRSLLI